MSRPESDFRDFLDKLDSEGGIEGMLGWAGEDAATENAKFNAAWKKLHKAYETVYAMIEAAEAD